MPRPTQRGGEEEELASLGVRARIARSPPATTPSEWAWSEELGDVRMPRLQVRTKVRGDLEAVGYDLSERLPQDTHLLHDRQLLVDQDDEPAADLADATLARHAERERLDPHRDPEAVGEITKPLKNPVLRTHSQGQFLGSSSPIHRVRPGSTKTKFDSGASPAPAAASKKALERAKRP